MTKNELKQMSMIINIVGSIEELSSSMFAKYTDVFKQLGSNPDPQMKFENLFAAHSEEARDLLKRMLQIDPSKRITIDEALRHPYFASYEDELEDLEDCERTFNTDFEESQYNEEALKNEVLKEIFSFYPELSEEQFSRQNQEYKYLRRSPKVHHIVK